MTYEACLYHTNLNKSTPRCSQKLGAVWYWPVHTDEEMESGVKNLSPPMSLRSNKSPRTRATNRNPDQLCIPLSFLGVVRRPLGCCVELIGRSRSEAGPCSACLVLSPSWVSPRSTEWNGQCCIHPHPFSVVILEWRRTIRFLDNCCRWWGFHELSIIRVLTKPGIDVEGFTALVR